MFLDIDDAKRDALKISKRKSVYNIVQRHAGCHLREIERRCRLPHGTVKYHLDYLSHHNLIRQEKLGNNVRYFPRNLSHEENRLLGALRSRVSRTIIIYMHSHSKVGQSDLVRLLELSPPTVSWHVKKMLGCGLISAEERGGKLRYSLNVRRDLVEKLLISYRRSFFDSLVDRTVETWE